MKNMESAHSYSLAARLPQFNVMYQGLVPCGNDLASGQGGHQQPET